MGIEVSVERDDTVRRWDVVTSLGVYVILVICAKALARLTVIALLRCKLDRNIQKKVFNNYKSCAYQVKCMGSHCSYDQ